MTESETRYQRIGREQAERQAQRAERMERTRQQSHRRPRKHRQDAYEINARLVYDHDRNFDWPGDDIPERPKF